jgi:hypothetical protein
MLPTGSPGFYADFIVSQQSQVTDSIARTTSICYSEKITTHTWQSSAQFCPYPTNPLP